MSWQHLTSAAQLEDIDKASASRPQVLLKHSTRCSISAMVWRRMQGAPLSSEADFYYLDLLANRQLSNTIAERYSVHHESPQIIVVRDGKAVYDESHMGIQMDEVEEQLLSQK